MTALSHDAEVVSDDLVAVSDSFVRLMRAFARTKAQLLDAAQHDVEWSAQMVLRCLANSGPLRSGGIADRLQADPSTVSRQVAALVKDGLVERRADPEDGRASLLVLTDQAGEVLKRHDDLRYQHFASMLSGWSERDLAKFATLMSRFADDYEAATTQLLTERAAIQPRPAEGNS